PRQHRQARQRNRQDRQSVSTEAVTDSQTGKLDFLIVEVNAEKGTETAKIKPSQSCKSCESCLKGSWTRLTRFTGFTGVSLFPPFHRVQEECRSACQLSS